MFVDFFFVPYARMHALVTIYIVLVLFYNTNGVTTNGN